jgi:putative transcriptional regulator
MAEGRECANYSRESGKGDGEYEVAKNSGAYLTGKILLAMPGMGDPRFHRAVIFLCAHDAQGAMGLVINNPLPGLDLRQLLQQMAIAVVDRNSLAAPVMGGGPVETARGFILHSTEFSQADTVKVTDHFNVTGTIDGLRAIAEGRGPERLLFMLGYAGWDAGQLDREIQENVWLVAEAAPDMVFSGTADEKWDRAVKSLGIDPAMLSAEAGRA